MDSCLGPQNTCLASKEKHQSEYTGPLVAVRGDETQIKTMDDVPPQKHSERPMELILIWCK